MVNAGHLPNTLVVRTGTTTAGNIASLYVTDTDYVNITEAAVANGMLILINYTEISTDNKILYLQAQYDGNPSHDVWIQIYNYTKANYDDIQLIPTGDVLVDYNQSIDTNQISGGVIQLKINHTSNGIATDYLTLNTAILLDVTTVSANQYVWVDGLGDGYYSMELCNHLDGCSTHNISNSTGLVELPLNNTKDYIIKIIPVDKNYLSLDFVAYFANNTMTKIILIFFMLVMAWFFVRVTLNLRGGI